MVHLYLGKDVDWRSKKASDLTVVVAETVKAGVAAAATEKFTENEEVVEELEQGMANAEPGNESVMDKVNGGPKMAKAGPGKWKLHQER